MPWYNLDFYALLIGFITTVTAGLGAVLCNVKLHKSFRRRLVVEYQQEENNKYGDFQLRSAPVTPKSDVSTSPRKRLENTFEQFQDPEVEVQPDIEVTESATQADYYEFADCREQETQTTVDQLLLSLWARIDIALQRSIETQTEAHETIPDCSVAYTQTDEVIHNDNETQTENLQLHTSEVSTQILSDAAYAWPAWVRRLRRLSYLRRLRVALKEYLKDTDALWRTENKKNEVLELGKAH
jgi:HAMP domain-containing protein